MSLYDKTLSNGISFMLSNVQKSVSFIEFFSEKVKNYPYIQFEVAPLHLGDIEIHYNEQLLFVWERKTFNDYISLGINFNSK